MGVRNARQYSKEERVHAAARTLEVGPSQASQELGIPLGTLSCWAFKARSGKLAAGGGTLPASSREPQPPPTEPAASPTIRVVPGQASEPGMPKRRVAKVYTPSQRAQALEVAAKEGVAAASRKLGVSRWTLQDWRRKVHLAATGQALESPVTGPAQAEVAAERDRRILAEWKKHPGLGPSQIRNQLRRAGLKTSVHTTRRVMMEHGYVPPKVERREHDGRYEAVRPNQLWHLDFFTRHIHKQKVSVLLVVDDYSRFIVGEKVWDEERADAVLDTVDAAVTRHGRPETVMSDGGGAFWAWKGVARFTSYLEELGVDQLIAKVPEVNGKSEVLNANVQKELFNQEMFFDLGMAQRKLSSWVSFYNLRRTHHSLGGLLVPADRYFGRVEEVLAQVEAGRAPDGVGEPIPVAERNLDLLRITSTRGEVSVTLMGRQLWPPA